MPLDVDITLTIRAPLLTRSSAVGERGIDAPRIEPRQLVGAERPGPLQVEVLLEVEAQLGAGHARDVGGVAQALLVPGLAAALKRRLRGRHPRPAHARDDETEGMRW